MKHISVNHYGILLYDVTLSLKNPPPTISNQTSQKFSGWSLIWCPIASAACLAFYACKPISFVMKKGKKKTYSVDP